MSKLLTIQGIGAGELELLDAAGWGDARALAGADPGKLTAELAKANSMLKIVATAPDQETVAGWVQRAQEMDGGPGSKPAAQPHKISVETARGTRPRKVEAKNPATKNPVVAVGEPAFKSEAAAAVVTAPAVNEFERMLSRAPVAIPIPARMLADRGITPSEIAIAPLLSESLGEDIEIAPVEAETASEDDLETVAEPEIHDLLEASSTDEEIEISRGGTGPQMVQVGDINVGVRRGIDVSRVRTLEEFQGDAPAQRNSASRAGMEDPRIALLRAPLPGTNGRRKPSSRFYIRGVLHDRPFVVWFGGLFAVLLQIMLPLAILSAPLLILADQKVKNFEWVPDWIIAFPIALPILAILYGIFSTGAKCRVCGQRLYVPKNCLKNRKAHNAPYFGHIGALAVHVMIFKWFNCTFCGTPIRIKK